VCCPHVLDIVDHQCIVDLVCCVHVLDLVDHQCLRLCVFSVCARFCSFSVYSAEEDRYSFGIIIFVLFPLTLVNYWFGSLMGVVIWSPIVLTHSSSDDQSGQSILKYNISDYKLWNIYKFDIERQHFRNSEFWNLSKLYVCIQAKLASIIN
jgi:hypothetical protein